MSDARILHFLTPLKHPSPFDVNIAIDAGFVVARAAAAPASGALGGGSRRCLRRGGEDGRTTRLLTPVKAAMGAQLLVCADESGRLERLPVEAC
jgi:hypothetical protein